MLLLNPRQVTFADQTWGRVVSVAIERSAERVLVEWSDDGPHAVFADVPEHRVNVRVVQEMQGDGADAPAPGAIGELRFTTGASGPAGTAGPARAVSLDAVVTAVSYEVSHRRGVSRRIDLVAVSPGGTDDPVRVEEL